MPVFLKENPTVKRNQFELISQWMSERWNALSKEEQEGFKVLPKNEGGQDQTARARRDRSRSPRKASGTPAATGGADQSKAEDAAQPQQSSALTAASATKATEAVPKQGEVPPPCKGGPGPRSRKKGGETKGRKTTFPGKLPTPKAAVSGPKKVPTPTAARGRVTRPSGSPAASTVSKKSIRATSQLNPEPSVVTSKDDSAQTERQEKKATKRKRYVGQRGLDDHHDSKDDHEWVD